MSEERKPVLVIFHGDCTDGFTAAWAAWLKLGDTAEYVPAMYRPTDVFDVDEREVYILDYCPTRPELVEYEKRAKKLTVIDHHKTAESHCLGLDFCHFDMNRSGATMSWDFFHPGSPRPTLVKYVEDRDLWRNSLPSSALVSAALFSYPHTFEQWSDLCVRCESDLPSLLLEGEALERAEAIAVKSNMKNASPRKFLGHQDVPVVNVSPGPNISLILNNLAPENYFAVGWYQRSNGTYKYSVRAKGTFDCAKLCEKFGGGGHKGASGFISSQAPWELEEKP